MTAEDISASTDTSTSVIVDSPTITDNSASTSVVSPEQSETAAMEAAWQSLHPHESVARGDDGKFKASEAGTETAGLEGAAGEEKVVDNSAVVDTPLPANLHGLEEEWPTLPAAVKTKLAERTQELHTRMSDMGRQLGTYKPLQEAASEFAEYFNGNLKTANGQPLQPADGIRYLANIQRSMDKDAPGTLMNIIDTYGAREQIAALLGVQSAPQDQTSRQLLDKIAGLERTISGLNDPARVEQVLDDRDAKAEVSRLFKTEPLVSEISSDDLVHFINKGWKTLGESATREQVFKYAVNAATEADPTLRAKTKAAKEAAAVDAKKAEGAKRANGVNVTSTSSGKSRPMTDDQAMEAEWNRLHSN